MLQIILRSGCTFELQSMKRVRNRSHIEDAVEVDDPDMDMTNTQPPLLKLKGQMLLLNDTQYIAFLCSPA